MKLNNLHYLGNGKLAITENQNVKNYKLENLEKNTRRKSINYERGGYYKLKNGKLCFTTKGKTGMMSNGRHCVFLNNNVNFAWHTHPRSTPWWPSWDDIITTTKKPQILITRYGTWVFSIYENVNINFKNNKNHTVKILDDIYRTFHSDMVIYHKKFNLNQRFDNGNYKVILEIIAHYIQFFHNNGLNIHFLPYNDKETKERVLNALAKYYNLR